MGIVLIFLKADKEPSDVFLIFITLAFVNILVDKNYVKLFITPIMSLLAAYGLFHAYLFFRERVNKVLMVSLMSLLLLICVAAAFVPQYREVILQKPSVLPARDQYYSAGDYIRELDCNCSTVTTGELVAGVTIFAASGVPGGSHNIYYYVNKSYLQTEAVNFSHAFETLKSGEKLTGFWRLPDWIFGGEYYHGRHTVNLFQRDFRDKISRRIVNDYKEYYYIHDKELEEPAFYQSMEPAMNRIYENSLISVHDLRKGRAVQ
ncbi:MAG: hypothetical protein HGA85_03830 [Nanoarchaeota archaeon]|nr:hypothetical protein [Nanoarchaeota archaeon]